MVDDPKSILDRLAGELDELRLQYELYFAGGRKIPPERDRTAFETTMRRLSQRTFVNTQDQFRFNSIQARYYSFLNHWQRTVRDMEEGRLTRDVRGRLSRPAPPPDDPIDPSHLEEAASRLAAARAECGLPPGNGEAQSQLKEALLARAREIAAKADGKKVEFRISVEEGKPKIRAVLK